MIILRLLILIQLKLSVKNVTLLDRNIDFMLRFDNHVYQICKRASKQPAALKRIRRFF